MFLFQIGSETKCRFSDAFAVTIYHLVSRPPMPTPNECKNNHMSVRQHLRCKICQHYKIRTPVFWYEYHAEQNFRSKDVIIHWDISDSTIQNNRPNSLNTWQELLVE